MRCLHAWIHDIEYRGHKLVYKVEYSNYQGASAAVEMASERWVSPKAKAVPHRRISCGHLESLRNAAETSMHCPHCICVVNFNRSLPTRDFVPNPDLTWPWAICKESVDLLDSDIQVCERFLYIFCLRLSPFRLHTTRSSLWCTGPGHMFANLHRHSPQLSLWMGQ